MNKWAAKKGKVGVDWLGAWRRVADCIHKRVYTLEQVEAVQIALSRLDQEHQAGNERAFLEYEGKLRELIEGWQPDAKPKVNEVPQERGGSNAPLYA